MEEHRVRPAEKGSSWVTQKNSVKAKQVAKVISHRFSSKEIQGKCHESHSKKKKIINVSQIANHNRINFLTLQEMRFYTKKPGLGTWKQSHLTQQMKEKMWLHFPVPFLKSGVNEWRSNIPSQEAFPN